MRLKFLAISITCLLTYANSQVNNNAIIYADQYTTLTYQQIVDTICPASGCTIYANNVNASHSIGSLDPGTKVVTVYLGPFTYNVDHIILRKGLKVIGMGASDAGTILQSVNTTNFPIFSLPQTSNTPATDVYLYGLRMLAAAGNTSQGGLWADCSALTNSGIWHSSFEDLLFLNFQGSAIGLFGPINNVVAANQFISFRNIWAIRPPGGGPDLRIEGANGQIDCIDCHLDGWGVGQVPPSPVDGWSNVFIGNLSGGTQTPYSIHFLNLTAQGANNGVQVQGGVHISFIGSHFEALNGAYQLNAGTGLPVRSIWMAHDQFNGNVGRDVYHPGNGYLVFAQNTVGVVFDSPGIDGTPERVVAGSSANNVAIVNAFSAQPGVGALTSKVAGNLSINGTISKAGGSFKIDHPLEPETKYLFHSFVESPDMKNIYDGIAVLNSKGQAEITLPDWFQALNQDFRYQLSCIGASAPVYVAQEIHGNKFKIAGGRPGLKVSWQLTGIRHDAYANEHRIPVEEIKPKQDLPDGVPAPLPATITTKPN